MKCFSMFTILSLSISVFFISCGADSTNTADSTVQKNPEWWPSTPVYVNEHPYNICGWEGKT